VLYLSEVSAISKSGDLIKRSANVRMNLNTRMEFYLERMVLYSPSIVNCRTGSINFIFAVFISDHLY